MPVVADFAGPTGIRAVANYLKDHHATVTAFYTSNVENYLFREVGAADRFYANVRALPLDSTTTFIRPRIGSPPRIPVGADYRESVASFVNAELCPAIPFLRAHAEGRVRTSGDATSCRH